MLHLLSGSDASARSSGHGHTRASAGLSLTIQALRVAARPAIPGATSEGRTPAADAPQPQAAASMAS